MGNAITGKEYSLYTIFNDSFEYHIPAYQRPYAWTTAEANALFDDLFDFHKSEKEDSYFLGSIVLIKDEAHRYAEVIDGQQRLTTLTILFSAIADSFHDPEQRAECKNFLQEPGKKLAGIPAQPRLFLREKDQAFFNKYIQNIDLESLVQIDPQTLKDEAQVHILENCKALRERIRDSFATDEELGAFCMFLVTRCFLIVVSTANQESAFRIFSVMNSRGMDLLPTDIIKSETIGKLPVEMQEIYTERWEDMECAAGRDGFQEIFTHTRMIFAKERPKKNLLDEFREYVMRGTTPESLIDDYLAPYTDAYVQLKNCAFTSTQHADEINRLLYWLNKTNNYDWMPSAIRFLADHANDSEYILWFIRKLERLASYLLVTARDVNQRMDRYKWILVEMEERPDSSLQQPLVNIELTEWEKRHFIETLNGEIYTMPSMRRNYILQRLDSFYSDGGVSYNVSIFTIEHILPQNPAIGSEWNQLWTEEQRGYWINRIANLVPLTKKKNSEAQNYEFAVKKEKYFTSKNGTSSFRLTTQVLSMDAWTPDIAVKRQEDLIAMFTKKWDLAETASDAESVEFMIAGRGGYAVGQPLEGGKFLVKKGSTVSTDTTEGFHKGYAALREQLVQDGVIQGQMFASDYVFDSPSAAAAVVLGRSANGRKEWIKLDGQTLAHAGY